MTIQPRSTWKYSVSSLFSRIDNFTHHHQRRGIMIRLQFRDENENFLSLSAMLFTLLLVSLISCMDVFLTKGVWRCLAVDKKSFE